MYVFLSGQQQRGRESGRGLGKLGWREEGGKGASFCCTDNSSPQIWGRGLQRWPKGRRVETSGSSLYHQRVPLLWHRYASIFILHLLSLSLSFFASLKKWRRDLHNFSGVSPSHLLFALFCPQLHLRHLPSQKKKSLPGLCLQRARVRKRARRESDLGRGQVACFPSSIKFLWGSFDCS